MRLADQFIFPLGNSMLRETAVLDTSGITPLKLLPCNIVKNLIKHTPLSKNLLVLHKF